MRAFFYRYRKGTLTNPVARLVRRGQRMQSQDIIKCVNDQKDSFIKVNDRNRQPLLRDKELQRGCKVREDNIRCKKQEQKDTIRFGKGQKRTLQDSISV